jgi:hypothetical protein
VLNNSFLLTVTPTVNLFSPYVIVISKYEYIGNGTVPTSALHGIKMLHTLGKLDFLTFIRYSKCSFYESTI